MLSKKSVVLALVLIISFSITSAKATLAPVGQIMPIDEFKVEDTRKVSDRAEINQIIERKAWVYGVNPNLISSIVSCESSFNINATNISPVEESYGLVQINTLVHDISIEQAKDPEFAIDFLAKNLKNGKAPRMWVTCYQKSIS